MCWEPNGAGKAIVKARQRKFLETEQYKRINEIDKKLWELVKS